MLDGVRLPIVPNSCLEPPDYAEANTQDKNTEAANHPDKLAAVRRGKIRLVNPANPHHPAILFRSRNNLTLDEAGRALGVSGMAVGHWERGINRTPADIHERIERWEKENA